MRSVSACGVPRYGMCATSMSVAMRNFSPAMCEALPLPEEPYTNFCGPAFTLRTRSCSEAKPRSGGTTSTLGIDASMVTGVKSFSVSYLSPG
ncbi:hypothetical protein D3C72_1310450 [compost metagenome]